MKSRKFKIISGLGLVLLAVLVTAGWFLTNDAWIKARLEQTVSELTGRSLSIDGAFVLDLSANPVLLAENIHFSNPGWASNPDLVRLDKLELSIDLLSVFEDQLRINYIDVKGLFIALEENEAGEKSWDILPTQEQQTAPVEQAPQQLPVNVGKITLADFTVSHADPKRAVPLDFHLKQLELSQDASQQLQFKTDGRFGGEPFAMAGDLGPLNELIAGGRTSHDIHLSLGEILLQSKGSIDRTATLSGANIKLDFAGPRIEWLLTQFAMPEFSHGRFDFKLNLQTEGDLTRLDLSGDLGSLKAYARGDFKDITALDTADLTADVSGDDLGDLLQVFGVSGIPGMPFSLKADISHASGLYQLRTLDVETADNRVSITGQMGDWPELLNTDLSFSLSGPDLSIWREALSTDRLPATDFDLSGQISRAGSEPASTDTHLRLGNSHLELSGLLGRLPQMVGSDLTITANGSVDGALAQMLEIEGISGKEFNLTAKLERDASWLHVHELGFDLADNHLVLSGKLGSWPGLTGTSLNVSLSGPDLSIWSEILSAVDLPASGYSVNGVVAVEDADLMFDDLNVLLDKNSLNLNGRVGLNKKLQGSDFKTNVIIPDIAKFGPLLAIEGLPAERLSVTGHYRQISEGWAFQLTNGSFAEASFESEGKVTGLEKEMQIEASSHIIAPDLARLVRLAGVENLPEQKLDIEGFVRYQAGTIELRDVQGTVGESKFKVSGKAMNPPTWSGSEVVLSASGPDIRQLLVNNELDDVLPFSINGGIKKSETGISISKLKGSLGLLQGSADGSIGKLDDISDTDLQLSITTPSLQPIGELLDYPLPDDPLSLNAMFSGSPSVFHLEQLQVQMGASDLAGDMDVNLEGKPVIKGTFKSDYLDLSWLRREQDEKNTGSDKPEAKSKQKYLIPDRPIDFTRIDAVDGDLNLMINKVDLPLRTLYGIKVFARTLDGNLYLDHFQVSGESGASLIGALTVEREAGSDITSVALSAQGEGVKLGIGAAEGQDPETIMAADINVILSGAGVTYRDLASSLNGHAEMIQGPGLTEAGGLGLIFGDFLGELLNMLNPFAKTEKFTKNECAVFAAIVESGVITARPLVWQAEKMTLVAEGVVDLNTENIQFTFNTKLRKGIGISASMLVNPFISVTGTLASPIIGLDPAAVAVKGTIAVATLGISLLVKSLSDRYFSSKDPCGDAQKQVREQLESKGQAG